jgi:hypothetical protein
MTCTSGSVQTVADKTVAAKSQIDKLQEMLKGQETANKTAFYEQIKSHLTDAKINDAKELSYNSDIKTEYVSEFSLDKIAAVVTKALKAAQAATDPTVPEAATSPAAIAAYTDVVNTVAEAAKSSSTSAGSLSFSMNRLSPGLYAFLYATSVTIKDVDTFGTEAVTSTGIYYRVMQSIDDIKNQAKFGAAIMDAKTLLGLKRLQAALVDDLAAGKIDMETWTKRDGALSVGIKTVQDRLDADKFNKAERFTLNVRDGFGAPVDHSFATGSDADQGAVRAAVQRLKSMNGALYKAAIQASEQRVASNYY